MNRWLAIVAAGAIAFVLVYLLGRDLTAAAAAAVIAALFVAVASWVGTANLAYATIAAIVLAAVVCIWFDYSEREAFHTIMFVISIVTVIWITIALVRALEYVVG